MTNNIEYNILPIEVDVKSNLQSINFYLVKTDQSLTLVDAGINRDHFYDALIETLHANNLDLRDLTEIILTHNHGDHVGLVNRITKKHPIPVYAHVDAFPRLKRDPEFFHMRTEFFANLYEEMGCGEEGKEQVAYLKETMEKNKHKMIQTDLTPINAFHSGFKTIHTPGHAQDHIVLFHEETGDLLAGDVLIKHISTNALVEPDNDGNRLRTLLQHKQSMEKLVELNVHTTYSGHGDIITDSKPLIERRIEGIEKKANKLKQLLLGEAQTAAQIAKVYYKNVYEKQFSLVMSEIIGHLDYLEAEKMVTKEKVDGVWYYSIH